MSTYSNAVVSKRSEAARKANETRKRNKEVDLVALRKQLIADGTMQKEMGTDFFTKEEFVNNYTGSMPFRLADIEFQIRNAIKEGTSGEELFDMYNQVIACKESFMAMVNFSILHELEEAEKAKK